MNLKEQIERVARLEEVVERYLPLQRNGSSTKTMIGLCPFHNDRHPSLHVNVKDQYYKCFACGEGGDLFKFVQKMEGCDFRGALKNWQLGTDFPIPEVTNRLPVFLQRKRQKAYPKPVLNRPASCK